MTIIIIIIIISFSFYHYHHYHHHYHYYNSRRRRSAVWSTEARGADPRVRDAGRERKGCNTIKLNTVILICNTNINLYY